MAPDESHPLRELAQELALRLGVHVGVQLALRPRNRPGDDRGGDDEARCVEPERRRRPEARDQESSERPADEQRPLLDAAADPARPLHADACELDDVGEERLARGRARRVEQRAEEYERHQLPELDPDRGVNQRDRRHRAGAREIRRDARRAESEPVDDDTAEERSENRRQEVEEHGEPGQSRASRRDEHEPRHREQSDRVPDERDRIRDVEGVQRSACRHRRHSGIGRAQLPSGQPPRCSTIG